MPYPSCSWICTRKCYPVPMSPKYVPEIGVPCLYPKWWAGVSLPLCVTTTTKYIHMNKTSIITLGLALLCLCACRTSKQSTSLTQERETIYQHGRAWSMQAVRLDTLTAIILRFDTAGRVIECTELVGRSRSSTQAQSTDTIYIHQRDTIALKQSSERTPTAPCVLSVLSVLGYAVIGFVLGAGLTLLILRSLPSPRLVVSLGSNSLNTKRGTKIGCLIPDLVPLVL